MECQYQFDLSLNLKIMQNSIWTKQVIDTSKVKFIKMIKDRSINNFNVDVNANDKILTLSTCTGNNARLVIHAKLMEV